MAKFNLPKSVKVGCFTYDVGLADVIVINGSAEYGGMCDYFNSEIKILKSLSDEKKVHTYLHEVIHAMFHEAGYPEHDEDMVVRLGNVLYQIVKDNGWKVGVGGEPK